MLAAYKITRVQGDRYAGEWPREQFRKRGVRYDVADKTASQLFVELLPLINAGTCRLLDHAACSTSSSISNDAPHSAPAATPSDIHLAVSMTWPWPAAGSLVQAMAKRPQIYINGRTVEENERHMQHGPSTAWRTASAELRRRAQVHSHRRSRATS